MTVRMTGITGLLDTDALVSASMEPYKLKVNTQKQNLQTMQWQQEQYRTIMKDSKSFYDKYLDPLGTKSLSLSSKYTTTKFTSDKENIVTATTSNGAAIDTYTVTVNKLAAKASTSLTSTEISALIDEKSAKNMKITVGGVDLGSVDISAATTADGAKTAVTELNTKLSGSGFTARYSEFNKGIIIEADEMNTDNSLEIGFTDASGTAITSGGSTSVSDTVLSEYVTEIKDVAANVTITNSKGEVNTYSGSSNSATIDGVTFNFKSVGDATLTGTADVTSFKENIISFVNDYNTLLENINTKIYESRDKSYTPLTDDQKDEMSDDEITKWETKAKAGLLRKDSDLEDLARSMKDAISTMMSGTGLSLEDIGIEPVEDYSDKNGMLTIDEDKLTSALETNFDNVKDLFIRDISSDDTTNGGVITKLKDAIYSNTISSTANLVNKAGKDSGVSSLTNEMSLKLTEMKKKIAEMEDALIDREDTLYTKYASLESALSEMQAQQSNLASYFGTSS